MTFAARWTLSVAVLAGLVVATACTGAPSGNDSSKPVTSGPTTTAPKKPAVAATGRVGGNVGDTAYNFTLEDVGGQPVRLSDFKGKVVVLDSWATWCPPCRREIPGFVQLHRELQGKGVEVVGVSLDDDWDPVRPFMTENNINYTIVLGDQDVASRYGDVRSIPTTFVIDRDGIIRSKHVGYGDLSQFRSAVEPLL